MKFRVVGWTYYDNDLPQGEISWAARNAVVDDIKKHGYSFSGWAHQEGAGCTPVLNDGKMYCFSRRGWGGVMAEAHGYTGRMDYAKYAFELNPDAEIRPKERFNEEEFIPERDLNERFELEVSQKIFTSAQSLHEIKLDDLPSLRYLDAGDVLVLKCSNQTAEYTVADVDRKRDLTEEKLWELQLAFEDFSNAEKRKRAEEEFNSTKVIMIIKLKD